jgi:hypothetical protein
MNLHAQMLDDPTLETALAMYFTKNRRMRRALAYAEARRINNPRVLVRLGLRGFAHDRRVWAKFTHLERDHRRRVVAALGRMAESL